MRLEFLLPLLLTLSACSGMPMTADAFREDTRNDKEFKSVPLPNVPFKVAEKRLTDFATKCLNASLVRTEMRGGGANSSVSRSHYVFTPKIERGKDRFTLTDQWIDKASHYLNKIPDDGMYALVIDLFPNGAGTRADFFFYNRLLAHWEKYQTLAMGWLTDEEHLCPDFT
jgi:hypothetical protein